MRNYTEKELESFKDKLLQTNDNGRFFRWLCWPGSPCSGVLPKFPRTPEYYFTLQAYTTGEKERESYCDYSVIFLVRVHNLPLNTVVVFMIMGTTMLLLMLPLCFDFYRKEKHKRRK